MDQPSIADLEFRRKKCKTRREVVLERTDFFLGKDWRSPCDPTTPRPARGREPYGLPVMLRVNSFNYATILALAGAGSERLWDGGFVVRGGVGAAVRGSQTVGADSCEYSGTSGQESES